MVRLSGGCVSTNGITIKMLGVVVSKVYFDCLLCSCVAGLFYTHLCDYFICQVILLLRISKTMSIPNCKSQGYKIFREFSNVTMSHMSGVTCNVAHVMCHMSGVMCHHFLFLFFFNKWCSQSVEGLLSMRPTPSSLKRQGGNYKLNK